MMFDMPLDQLRTYRPERDEPPDFDAFWQETLAEARSHPLDAVFTPVDAGLRTVETYDVTFSGYGGHRIKGWLLLPRQRAGALPCVVEYISRQGEDSVPVCPNLKRPRSGCGGGGAPGRLYRVCSRELWGGLAT